MIDSISMDYLSALCFLCADSEIFGEPRFNSFYSWFSTDGEAPTPLSLIAELLRMPAGNTACSRFITLTDYFFLCSFPFGRGAFFNWELSVVVDSLTPILLYFTYSFFWRVFMLGGFDKLYYFRCEGLRPSKIVAALLLYGTSAPLGEARGETLGESFLKVKALYWKALILRDAVIDDKSSKSFFKSKLSLSICSIFSLHSSIFFSYSANCYW